MEKEIEKSRINEAEFNLLSIMLQYSNKHALIFDNCSPEFFKDRINKLIFHTASILYANGGEIDNVTIFEKIKSGDGEFEAASLGGSYLIAHTLGEVPADEDSGNIIFVARPYAKQSDGSTVWGEAFVAIYNAGALVSIDLAGK